MSLEREHSMLQHFCLQTRMLEEHNQKIERELAQRRLLTIAYQNRRKIGRHMVSMLGARLVTFGNWLEKAEKAEKAEQHQKAIACEA